MLAQASKHDLLKCFFYQRSISRVHGASCLQWSGELDHEKTLRTSFCVQESQGKQQLSNILEVDPRSRYIPGTTVSHVYDATSTRLEASHRPGTMTRLMSTMNKSTHNCTTQQLQYFKGLPCQAQQAVGTCGCRCHLQLLKPLWLSPTTH